MLLNYSKSVKMNHNLAMKSVNFAMQRHFKTDNRLPYSDCQTIDKIKSQVDTKTSQNICDSYPFCPLLIESKIHFSRECEAEEILKTVQQNNPNQCFTHLKKSFKYCYQKKISIFYQNIYHGLNYKIIFHHKHQKAYQK